MRIKLEKASGRAICRNHQCKKNSAFISDAGRIKFGSTCAAIRMQSASGFNTSYYCRECIEEIYLEMKKYLNPELWTLL